MSKADKMFSELGYKKERDDNVIWYVKEWGSYDEQSGFEEWASFSFDVMEKLFSADESYEPKQITIAEMEAVDQKRRELGWLDE